MSARQSLLLLLGPTFLIGATAACLFMGSSPSPAQAQPQANPLAATDGSALPFTTAISATDFDNAIFILAPAVRPERFVDCVDNRYFPLIPGTIYAYETATEDGLETNLVTVTNQIRQVMGILATVVLDTVWLDDELAEDTEDWYAQDKSGNVWYLGEETAEYENGAVVSTEGSWEAGVGGAKPGIYMLDEPFVGDMYRQEYLKDEAIDMAAIDSLDAPASVPFGDLAQTLKTTDYNPLARMLEYKYYASGVGTVLETSFDASERTKLIAVSHVNSMQDAARTCGGEDGGVPFVGTLPVSPGTPDLAALAQISAVKAEQIALQANPGLVPTRTLLTAVYGFIVYKITLSNGMITYIDAGDAALLTVHVAPQPQLFATILPLMFVPRGGYWLFWIGVWFILGFYDYTKYKCE